MSALPYNFESFLVRNSQVSDKTLRNYRADLAHFLNWAKSFLNLKGISVDTDNQVVPHFSSYLIKEYIQSQTVLRTPPATINRRLSTVRAFGKYLVWSGYIKENPAATLTNLSNPKPQANNWSQEAATLLAEFETYLRMEGVSRATIKNYLSDVRQFLLYLSDVFPGESVNLLEKATLEVVNKYKSVLDVKKSALTLKRAASSFKKFFTWAQKAGYVSSNPLQVIIETPISIPSTTPMSESVLVQALQPEVSSPVFIPATINRTPTKDRRKLVIVASVFSTLSILLIVLSVFAFSKEEPAKKTKKQASKVTTTTVSVLGASGFKRSPYPLPAPGITFGDLLNRERGN